MGLLSAYIGVSNDVSYFDDIRDKNWPKGLYRRGTSVTGHIKTSQLWAVQNQPLFV
jgi:hypothetical protein